MKIVYIIIIVVLGLGTWAFLGGDAEESITNNVQEEVTTPSSSDNPDVSTETLAEEEVMADNEATAGEEKGKSDEVMEEEGISVDEQSNNSATFDVDGSNYSFNMKEIRVKKGDTVTINFKSTGGLHDWVLLKFNTATKRVSRGGFSSVTFVADTVGEYEYYCSVGNHRARGMVGTLIVE